MRNVLGEYGLRVFESFPLLSDVVITSNGRKIHANKAILAARSEHFLALLFGCMKEGAEGVIQLDELEYPAVEALVIFLYTDQLVPLPLPLTVQLMMAAEQFLLPRLKALCQDRIKDNIAVDNVVEILRVAHYHMAQSLKELCMEFVCARCDEVKHTEAFAALVHEPSLLMEIFTRITP